MANFCEKCGKPQTPDHVCGSSVDSSQQPQPCDYNPLIANSWDAIKKYPFMPMDVVHENVKKQNWMTAVGFMILYAILQIPFGSFKGAISSLLVMICLVPVIQFLIKVFNKNSGNFLDVLTLVGFSGIMLIPAKFISMILFKFTYGLALVFENFANFFWVFVMFFTIKRIYDIKDEQTLVFLAACSMGAFSFLGYVIRTVLF